jgi:hypothetical protein
LASNVPSNPSPISGVPPPEEHQFKPGWKGGPGRPRKGFFTDEAAEYLQEEHPKRPGKTRKKVLIEQWVGRAAKDQRAMDSLVDRIEGKPEDSLKHELTGKDGAPLVPPIDASVVTNALSILASLGFRRADPGDREQSDDPSLPPPPDPTPGSIPADG